MAVPSFRLTSAQSPHLVERDELDIDVAGAAVGVRHAGSGDDDGPDQAAVGVRLLRQHAAVQPQLAAGVLVGARRSLRASMHWLSTPAGAQGLMNQGVTLMGAATPDPSTSMYLTKGEGA